ncbi:MAG: RNA polymerase factor sigma-54 [Sphingorhabdus sp.]
MALAPRLDLRQSQSLVMTPQLQQAIKLLALSSLEIEAYVAGELERNPLLDNGAAENSAEEAPDMAGDGPPQNTDDGPRDSKDILSSSDMSAGEALDVNYDETTFHHDSASDMPQAASVSASGGADGMLGLSGDYRGGSGEGPDFDSFAAEEAGLQDYLKEQAGTMFFGSELFLVMQLIEEVDPSGYLGADLLEIGHRLGVSEEDMEDALVALQMLDPTGVGARGLSECLALQAKEANRYDPCMAKLIDNLDLVARGGFDQLRRMCRVDEEDLRGMLSELRSYDPKPGARFGGEASIAVTPDIFLVPRGKSWVIELNSANLPRLLVNRSYMAEFGGKGADAETKKWLSECLDDANWLIKAMDQRQKTILKVAGEILKQQEGFFREGISQLKPLTLRQVADAIDMHESTVSRVTSNKYLSCDRGLFDLKYFFSSGVASADGEGASAESVKAAIRTLIDGEGAKILSDDKLVVLLKDDGFDLARRTVAKYREAMGIGSSVQRRRQMKMGG